MNGLNDYEILFVARQIIDRESWKECQTKKSCYNCGYFNKDLSRCVIRYVSEILSDMQRKVM